MPQYAKSTLSRCPPTPEREAGGRQDKKKNNTKYAMNHLNPDLQSPETCRVPQTCGPNTQTSPDTERGGRIDEIRDPPPPSWPKKTIRRR